MKFKTIIAHWTHNDGWHRYYMLGREIKEFHESAIGWSCWVYPADDINLDKWMEENMTGEFDCTFRFNSGDPIYTVFIKKDEDATLFKLRWM